MPGQDNPPSALAALPASVDRCTGADRAYFLRWACIWLMIALGVRTASAVALGSALVRAEKAGIASDGTKMYSPMAKNLAAGNGFCVTPGSPSTSHVPGYPLMVAGVQRIVSSHRAAITIVQVISGTLVVGLTFILTFAFAGPVAAHLAALGATFLPDMVLYSMLNLSDMPFLVFVLLGTLVMLKLLHTPTIGWAVLAGVVIGLGTLVRESMVAFALAWGLMVLAGFFAKGRKVAALQRIALAGGMVIATAIMMTPWWVRNYTTFGEFIPLTTKGALNVYAATRIRPYYMTDARNEGIPLDPEIAKREAAVYERLAESTSMKEADRILFRAAAENWKLDPIAQIKHLGNKLLWLWEANIAPRHAARIGFAPALYLVAGAHYVFSVLGVIGLWMMRRNREAIALLIVPFIVVNLFHVIVGIGEPRYHLPVFPILFVSSAVLIARGITAWRARAPLAE